MHSELIIGSGLHKMLETNDLSIMGRFAAVDVNDTKRARYC